MRVFPMFSLYASFRTRGLGVRGNQELFLRPTGLLGARLHLKQVPGLEVTPPLEDSFLLR